MKQVNSATLEKYNANNRGKSVGDCVKRGISLAFDLPYAEVGKILNAKMKELRKSAWNIQPVFEPVIRDLGCSNWKEGHSGWTVEDFVDNTADPNKTYLLLVGKKYPSTSHLVCVRDGKVWDSWDCRDYEVTRYYIIADTVQHKEFTDIKEHLDELSRDYIYPILTEERIKQLTKYKLVPGTCTYSVYRKGDYGLKTVWSQEFVKDNVITKRRIYKFEIAFPFEPTTTVEEAIKFIQTTGKVRMYDRIYAIAAQEKNLREEYEMLAQLGKDKDKRDMWMTSQELRFLNTLPGWARALVKYIRITEPGQYHDSYEVKIDKLPGDETHPDYNSYELIDYDAAGIRKQLDRYAKYGEIADIDYEHEW